MLENMLDLVTGISEQDIVFEIQKNPHYINRVEKTPERCMIAVKQKGLILKDIPKSMCTLELCIEAVKQNGWALKYVPEKLINTEICLIAVENDGDALMYTPDEFQTNELYIEAVKQNGTALQYVPNKSKTKKVCMIAINQNGKALQYVPNRILSNEIYAKAIEQNGLALKYVQEKQKSKELCELAVSKNALALEYVPEKFKTKELCEFAMQQDWKSFLYVSEDMYILETCINLFKHILKCFPDLKEILYNERSYIDEIVEALPESINTDIKIIRLERQLGARKFISKLYDKNIRKFITKEYIPFKEEYEDEEECEVLEFDTFIEFYDYLDGDLTNSDLYDYDFEGVNLKDLNIEDIYISSDVLVSQNLYDDSFYNDIIREYIDDSTLMFSAENEIVEAGAILHELDFESVLNGNSLNNDSRKIYYISDIHITNKLINKFPLHATGREIVDFVMKFVSNIFKATGNRYDDYLLIAGDVSFNYDISDWFYSMVKKEWHGSNIVVILGNHELWDFNKKGKTFPNVKSVDEIIQKYRELFNNLGITFLHNDLFLLYEGRKIVISEEQLKSADAETIKNAC
jgi:calcineurin-like phosphoesterase family protein